MELLNLDIFGQSVVQLVLDNSQEQVLRHLEQQRTSVQRGQGLGAIPEESNNDDTSDLVPLESDPAAFAMIESLQNGFSYPTEQTMPLPQDLQFQDASNYQLERSIDQPQQEAPLDMTQHVTTAPVYGGYTSLLQGNSDNSKEVDRTFLDSYDEDYLFQS